MVIQTTRGGGRSERMLILRLNPAEYQMLHQEYEHLVAAIPEATKVGLEGVAKALLVARLALRREQRGGE